MKIVKILDDYTYVINEGTFGGVKKGQKCYIYRTGEEIIDPSTKETLGYLEIPKAYCTVIHAQDHMSTIQSDDAPTPFNGIMGLKIKLNYDYFEKSMSEEMKEIKIGDDVNIVKI
jgi:hypothetical protein